jgi:hypothetical protein
MARKSPLLRLGCVGKEVGMETNLLGWLALVLGGVRRERSYINELDVRNDGIEQDLKGLIKTIGEGGPIPPPPPRIPVAYNLNRRRQPDGSFEFSIDGGKWFHLPPMQAELLRFLASGEPDPEDKLVVGRRTIEEIGAFFKSRYKKQFTKHNLIKKVFDLRNALKNAGYKRALIQTSKTGSGYRLALIRRPGPTATGTKREPPERPALGHSGDQK